jgi:hypothetical protein
MGRKLFQGLEGIIIDGDKVRARIRVDGQAIDAGGLSRNNREPLTARTTVKLSLS